jgi:hypothetical protein
VIVVASWLALQPYGNALQVAREWSGRCLGATSAIITADLLTRKWRAEGPHAVDWIGLISLVAGLATPLCITLGRVEWTFTPWWYPWMLPSYIVTFFVCSIGRFAQRLGMLCRAAL